MKKSFSALLIIFSLFLTFACKGNVNPSKPEEITTGTITGKAVYQNAAESSGITVTLEKTDGLRSLSVVRSIELEFDDFSARSIAGNSTTDKEGNYTFTDVEEGVYTIYASSKDSTEKAVTTNVVVERNASVTAEDLKLTATGNISGKITLDNSETESYGFIIYIAGTSYSAATDIDGSFLITGIPAKSGYHLLVTKQQLTYMFEEPVTVTAKETTTIPAKNFATSEITAGYTDGKDGTSMKWLGSFASEEEIEEPKYLDAYFNTEDGCSYIYDGEKWNLLAKGNAESQDEHSHTYSDEWSSNDDFHWRGATCEHKEQITDFGIHNYIFFRVIKEPSCISEGKAEYKCDCGKTDERLIPRTDHSYSEDWSYNTDYHWHETVCNNHSAQFDLRLKHELEDYGLIQQATETSNAVGQRYCKVCNYYEYYDFLGTRIHEHSYDEYYVCECGATKELSVQEFLSCIKKATHITTNKRGLGICWYATTGVNIAGIKISGEFSNGFHFPATLETADLSGLDTSDVTDMSSMFSGCENLTSLDVSNFDTSNVTDMSSMFSGCRYLTSLDVSNFDTSNVTDMSSMFSNCGGLTSLDVSNFDTSNVTDMRNMFVSCFRIHNLDVSNFNTSSVTNISYMFHGCSSLISLNVSNFNTSNVTDMISMFYGCRNLTSLDVSNFDTSNVTGMSLMFSNCSGLTSLDVSNFDTSNVTGMSYMFDNCTSLKTIFVSDYFDTTSLQSELNPGWGMFFNCFNLVGAIPFDSEKTDANYANYTTGYFTLKQ